MENNIEICQEGGEGVVIKLDRNLPDDVSKCTASNCKVYSCLRGSDYRNRVGTRMLVSDFSSGKEITDKSQCDYYEI